MPLLVQSLATEKLLPEVTVPPIVILLKVRFVPEFEIDEPLFMVMVPFEGAKVAVELLVRVPPTAKLEEVVTVAPVAMVKPEKVRLVPELTIEDPLPIEIVPPEGTKVAVELLVNAPLTPKLEEVVTVAPDAMVKPLKVRLVPEFEIDEPLFIVIVPADGAKVAVELLVKAPPTAKLDEVVTVAPEAMVKPENVRLVPELLIDAPLFIVMVPADGAKVAVELLVRAPPTAKLEEVVTVAPLAIVRPEKVRLVPEFEIDEPLFIVIVPPEAVKVAVELLVKAPLTTKLEDVVTVAPVAIVSPEKLKLVPELEIEAPLFIVIMPAEGAKVAVELLVKGPPTAKLDEVVTVAPASIVRPEKVRFELAPPLLTIEPPFFIVTVPLVGAKVAPILTVNAPATYQDVTGWTEGVAATVIL